MENDLEACLMPLHGKIDLIITILFGQFLVKGYFLSDQNYLLIPILKCKRAK